MFSTGTLILKTGELGEGEHRANIQDSFEKQKYTHTRTHTGFC